MDRYPTEDELAKIENWDFKTGSIREFIDMVRSLWHWEDYTDLEIMKAWSLVLHTGGWSGNEEIIEALQKNFIFWSMTWQKSERGGHYYFKINPELFKVK
jgi:hypothetical protein